MKKQMKKAVYEAPVTERFSVELEGGFMAGSVIDDRKDKVTSGEQLVNEEGQWGNFTQGQFSDEGWN